MPKQPAKKAANLLKARTPKKRTAKKRAGGKTKTGRTSPFHPREVAVFLLFLAFAGLGALGATQMASSTTIARGVSVGPFDVGGLTKDQAVAKVAKGLNDYALRYDAAGVGEQSIPVADDRAVRVDVNAAVAMAFSYGRSTNMLLAATDRVKAGTVGAEIPLPHQVDAALLTNQLTDKFPTLIHPAKDASLRITMRPDGSHETTVVPERPGTTIDSARLAQLTSARIAQLSSAPISVTVSDDKPALTASDVAPLTAAVTAALDRAPITLAAGDESWTLSKDTLAAWLVPTAGSDGHAELSLDRSKLDTYLSARGDSIATPPVDAKFVEKDGKVVTFTPSKDGQAIDTDGAYTELTAAILGAKQANGQVTLPMKTVPPKISTAQSNPYGISGIVGTGATNFKGSPPNRVHNIKRGAELLNGTLVKPGENFSLLAQLKPFDASGGYLPELVIKDNQTLPEYGGGLCQIGTTMFRTVLNSGLPVTMRQNHSYRVPYYERDGDGNYIGPGKDATIYDPSPDFKFLNDTGGEILIETKIEGTRLTFTLWGKPDGRTETQSDVKVSNIIPAPPAKITKTTDLPVGREKCTESAHEGSTAVFTYTVTYPDGKVAKKDFKSVYKPWQKVCLIGATQAEVDAQQAADAAAGTSTASGNPGLSSADAAGVSGQ